MWLHPDTDFLTLLPVLTPLIPGAAQYALAIGISSAFVRYVISKVGKGRERRRIDGKFTEERQYNDDNLSALKARVEKLERRPMEIFKQTDPRWADLNLGVSPYKMGRPTLGFGCTTTCVAQALALAGWGVDPGVVNRSPGMYTDNNYSAGAGLILWLAGVERTFPQFHFNERIEGKRVFELWKGDLGFFSHWALKEGDTFYDPITGSNQLYAPVKNWRRQYVVSIDQYVAPAPAYQEPVAQPQPVNIPVSADPYHTPQYFADKVMVKTPWSAKEKRNLYLYNRVSPNPTAALDTEFPSLKNGWVLNVKGAVRGTDGEVWYISAQDHYFNTNFTNKPLS